MIPILESTRLIYKPLTIAHCSLEYVKWMNDCEVNQFLESGGNYTIKKLEEYLQSVIKKEDMLFWAIHLKENDEHIGNIKIDPINKKHGLGEYGILIGAKKTLGKRICKRSLSCYYRLLFQRIRFKKNYTGCSKSKHISVRII